MRCDGLVGSPRVVCWCGSTLWEERHPIAEEPGSRVECDNGSGIPGNVSYPTLPRHASPFKPSIARFLFVFSANDRGPSVSCARMNDSLREDAIMSHPPPPVELKNSDGVVLFVNKDLSKRACGRPRNGSSSIAESIRVWLVVRCNFARKVPRLIDRQ